jgi:hypothetical protein
MRTLPHPFVHLRVLKSLRPAVHLRETARPLYTLAQYVLLLCVPYLTLLCTLGFLSHLDLQCTLEKQLVLCTPYPKIAHRLPCNVLRESTKPTQLTQKFPQHTRKTQVGPPSSPTPRGPTPTTPKNSKFKFSLKNSLRNSA